MNDNSFSEEINAILAWPDKKPGLNEFIDDLQTDHSKVELEQKLNEALSRLFARLKKLDFELILPSDFAHIQIKNGLFFPYDSERELMVETLKIIHSDIYLLNHCLVFGRRSGGVKLMRGNIVLYDDGSKKNRLDEKAKQSLADEFGGANTVIWRLGG